MAVLHTGCLSLGSCFQDPQSASGKGRSPEFPWAFGPGGNLYRPGFSRVNPSSYLCDSEEEVASLIASPSRGQRTWCAPPPQPNFHSRASSMGHVQCSAMGKWRRCLQSCPASTFVLHSVIKTSQPVPPGRLPRVQLNYERNMQIKRYVWKRTKGYEYNPGSLFSISKCLPRPPSFLWKQGKGELVLNENWFYCSLIHTMVIISPPDISITGASPLGLLIMLFEILIWSRRRRSHSETLTHANQTTGVIFITLSFRMQLKTTQIQLKENSTSCNSCHVQRRQFCNVHMQLVDVWSQVPLKHL